MAKDKPMQNNPELRPAKADKGPQRLDNSRFLPANRKRLSPPALRTFLAIADLWGLTEEQRLLVLGYPSRSTYHNWCKQAREHGASPSMWTFSRVSLRYSASIKLLEFSFRRNGSALSG